MLRRLAMFMVGYAILGSALVPSAMRWMDAHGIPPMIEDLIMCGGLFLLSASLLMHECRQKV